MPVVNYTDFLNEKMYRRLIENILLHIDPRPNTVKKFMDSWTIKLHPLSQTKEAYFQHTLTTSGQRLNPDMPSGVTGKFVIDLFLHDSSNQFKFRENADRIQHEICHAKLYGTPYFVKGVHDLITPTGGYIKSFKFKFWTNRWMIWNMFDITVIDIREHLQ